MRSIQLTLVAVVAVALSACGGAKLSKEGAVQALFQAQQPSSKAGQSLVERALASGATTITVEADCTRGGKAKVVFTGDAGNTSGSFTYKLTYNNCNQDGANTYNGTLDMTYTFSGSPTSAEVAMAMKGRIDISGEISDYVDANITLTVSATATSATSGSVTIRTNGSIRTSAESYTYNNETITITADSKLDPVG
jgi:hypothetical protein